MSLVLKTADSFRIITCLIILLWSKFPWTLYNNYRPYMILLGTLLFAVVTYCLRVFKFDLVLFLAHRLFCMICSNLTFRLNYNYQRITSELFFHTYHHPSLSYLTSHYQLHSVLKMVDWHYGGILSAFVVGISRHPDLTISKKIIFTEASS